MKLNKAQVASAICLVIGLILFIAGFAMLDFDITKLSTVTPYRAESFSSSGPVRAIYVDDSNASIECSPSTDDKVHITYYENDQEYYDISQSSNGDLNIKNKSHRQWYDYIFNIQFEQPKLLVEVPMNYYGDITVKSHDGNVLVKDINVDDLLLTTLDDEIQIQNVSASGRLEVKAFDDSIYLVT